MIPANLMEVHRYTGPGFLPLIRHQSWRVAMMNFTDELHPAHIDTMERHLETDEVFMLVHGHAILFIAGGEGQVTELHPQVMEPGVLYNIKPQGWHTVAMSHDASILIVENVDTGMENSEFVHLEPELRQFIQETAGSDWS